MDLTRAFLDAGVRFLQVRAKELESGPLLELCDAATSAARPYDAAVVVNDRADLAFLSGAAGVHVGQEDLPPVEARRLVGADAIVGLSTHTVTQVEAALQQPISYVAVGPVFGTRTKDTGYAAVGLDLVATASRMAGRMPVVAIGGITLENASSALEAGATSVAVISDLLVTDNVRARVQAYLQSLSHIAYSRRAPDVR